MNFWIEKLGGIATCLHLLCFGLTWMQWRVYCDEWDEGLEVSAIREHLEGSQRLFIQFCKRRVPIYGLASWGIAVRRRVGRYWATSTIWSEGMFGRYTRIRRYLSSVKWYISPTEKSTWAVSCGRWSNLNLSYWMWTVTVSASTSTPKIERILICDTRLAVEWSWDVLEVFQHSSRNEDSMSLSAKSKVAGRWKSTCHFARILKRAYCQIGVVSCFIV